MGVRPGVLVKLDGPLCKLEGFIQSTVSVLQERECQRCPRIPQVFSPPLIIELQIPDKVVFQRTKDAHRDSLGSVEQRLKDYHREMDLLQLYFPAAEVVHVDGTKSVNQVGEDIAAILKKRFGPRRGRRP